jgi:transcriptional regulator with XRE-family HTH domain
MVEKANGVLGEALREFIINHDLTIKEVAFKMNRGRSVVNQILRGEKVGVKTIRRLRVVYPQVFD